MPECCISVQRICHDENSLPSQLQLKRWCQLALEGMVYDINIRLVDPSESQQLNQTYRHTNKPTNVLSFPCAPIEGIEDNLLGDIVICPAVIAQEAKTQHKLIDHHWAHMIIHGVLHLRGFNHISYDQAQVMEQKEIYLLAEINIPNPYGDTYE